MANNLIPPKLQSSSIVAREIEAHFGRALTREHLLNRSGIRRDLLGEPIDRNLAQTMLAQLATGYDYAFDYNREDNPIRPGARIGLWCYSPWLDAVDPHYESGRFRLPQTAQAFLDHFAQATGITEDAYDIFAHNFGVAPTTIAAEWVKLPTDQQLFIISREYQSATKIWPELNNSSAFNDRNKKFGRPLIHAFALMSEIDRDALIQADMTILNLLSCADIRQWLDGDGSELTAALNDNYQLQRVLEYQVLSTDVINTVLEKASQNTTDLPSIQPFATADRLISHACQSDEAGALTRSILRAAFADPKQNSRPSSDPIWFYGLSSPYLGHGFMGDVSTGFRGGGLNTHLKRAKLQQFILAHVDRLIHDQILRRSGSKGAYQDEIDEKEIGKGRQANSEQLAKFSLPAANALGGAPRARIDHWLNPYKDKDLWGYFAGDNQKILRLGLSLEEYGQVVGGLAQMRRIMGIPVGIAPEIILQVCCDLATSVSCISTNRAFTRGIELLMAFNKLYVPPPTNNTGLVLPKIPLPAVLPVANAFFREKTHGSRVIAKVAGFLNHRDKIGTPPTGPAAKGTSRNQRRLAKKALGRRDVKNHRTNAAGAQLSLEQVKLLLASDEEPKGDR